jgi:LytS/YehU family sensor histidine kinase
MVVHKPPFWWEQPWVIALALVLGVLVTVALTTLALRRSHRKNMDQLAQEDRMRELERVAITRLLTSHYLFNALATIRSVARRSTDEVNSYIGRLSKVIRALIDRTSQNEVDLQSELDWIRDYVALESVGRQLPLRFDVAIDETIDPEEIFLPAFILQPIVENAMFHGDMKQDPVIRCDIRFVDQRLHIFIRNRIDAGSPTVEPHGSSSKGLAFMTERLKGWGRYHGLHLETDDVLRIRQTDSEWTIEIILPLVNHDLPLVTRN